jgi:hypothetical protein
MTIKGEPRLVNAELRHGPLFDRKPEVEER